MPTAPTGGQGAPITGLSSIYNILNNIVTIVQWAFFAIAIIFIFMAGFAYLTSAGNPEKVQQTHTRLMYAVIALVVGLMAYGMQGFVLSALQTLAIKQGG